MTTSRFHCSLRFADAWRATPDEINTLLEAMLASFSISGVEGVTIGGDIQAGSLDLSFGLPPAVVADGDEDSLPGMMLVVKALNAGRVLAPGWPTNEDIKDALASVRVRELSLA
jgi:hypothetical protein